jgi:hypothetical protein
MLPPITPPPPSSTLQVGIAAVDRSGRLREQRLLHAFCWAPGDRTTVEVQPRSVIMWRDGRGRAVIDTRGQFFLPAAGRRLFGIAPGDRVVLLAEPQAGLLVICPVAIVAALVSDLCATMPGGSDVR